MKQEDFIQGKLQEKYHTNNIIYRKLVNKFNSTLLNLLVNIKSTKKPTEYKILEIGVGEGQITELCFSVFSQAKYTVADIAPGILDVARSNLSGLDINVEYELQDIHQLPYAQETFDIVICCEVLEHVDNPQVALDQIYKVLKSTGAAIISVPNEPIWRIANMIRGSYWSQLGNTPGHINHWSPTKFKMTLRKSKFYINSIHKPFPWITTLLRKNYSNNG